MIIFYICSTQTRAWHLPVALQQRSLMVGKMNECLLKLTNASQSLPIKILFIHWGLSQILFLPVYMFFPWPQFDMISRLSASLWRFVQLSLVWTNFILLLLGTYQEALLYYSAHSWTLERTCHVLYLPTPLPANPDLAQFSVLWYSTYMDLLLNWIAFSHFLVGSIILPWRDSFYFLQNLAPQRRKRKTYNSVEASGEHSALCVLPIHTSNQNCSEEGQPNPPGKLTARHSHFRKQMQK